MEKMPRFIWMLFLIIALSFCLAASSPVEVVAENPVNYNTSFCSPDMISYWKLDETEGTIYEDFVGENDGVCSIHDCPDPEKGLVIGAQKFLGSQGIDVPVSDDFNWDADSDFSVELWVNIPEGETCSGRKVFIGRYAGLPGWWVGCENESNEAIFLLRDSESHWDDRKWISGGPALNDGEWHHVVAVRDGENDEIQLFVDSILVASDTVTFEGDWISDEALNIGHYYVPFDDPQQYLFNGLLDEIAVYRRTLTASEIQDHYQKGLEGQGYCVPVQLTIFIEGNGMVNVNPPEPYILGQLVTLTAQADDGQIFYEWSGDLTGYANPASLLMDADKIVTVIFSEPVWYTLTVNTIGQGSVLVEPPQDEYLHGITVTLTAVEQPGWKFSGWQGDLNGDNQQANLLMTDNYSVTAVFTEIIKRTYLPLTMK
jgi:hypothetical protein